MFDEDTVPARPGDEDDWGEWQEAPSSPGVIRQADTSPSKPEPPSEPTRIAGQPIADEGTSKAVAIPGIGNVNPRLVMLGCGGLILLALVVLAVVALFLPPLNLAAQIGGGGCKRLSDRTPAARHSDGVAITLIGQGSPCVGLKSIPRATFLAGEAGKAYEEARAAILPSLEMKSPLYILSWRGQGETVVEIDIPNESEPYHTLDLYTWDKTTDKWVFVPSHIDLVAQVIRTDERPANLAVFQTRPATPLISTTVEANQVLDGTTASALNLVFPTGLRVRSDGALEGALIGGWELGAGYAVVPLIRADSDSSLTDLLNNQTTLALHIDDLVNFVIDGGYNGVAIDYADVAPTDRAVFTDFITDLGVALDQNNKLLVVVLPPPTNDPTGWETGGYDWRAIGRAADIVIISAGPNPADYAINGTAMVMLNWAVGEISRYKLHLAFSTLSADEANGLTLISYDDAMAPLGVVTLETPLPEGGASFEPGASLTFNLSGNVSDLTPDQNTGAYTYVLSGDEGQRRIWIVTASTIRARLDLAALYNIGGMVLNDLLAGGNDAGLVTVINEFKARSVSSVPSQLVMQWTVTGASGAVLSETTGLGTPLVWQAPAPGNYSVRADIVGGRVSDRGSVSVQVGEAAPEQTAIPTPTAAPTRNPNATPASTQTTPTPPPTNSTPPPSAGGAGWDGGGFELGGQVPNAIGHADFMKQAGMTWVKFQIVWPYTDAATAGAFVGAGHAAGFKVLLSIKGPLYPQSIDFPAYTEFVRQVAAYKPDAIEVWNEMNLNREWPAGQVDPTSYVNNMLAPAFNAIKTTSPGTMVIIGALAPTGVNDDGNIWSDDRYVQGMAAAGAAKYANCIGVHHNAGATPPSVSTGHPGGSHYSWYFQPTINVYYGGMGGALPICFTEYGYVSPEGYGQLPSNFSWGSDNTVAEQAAWLKEGVQIAKGLGYVRLMIIFNVDFTYWASDDPQAGYAIVRPDGTCPACVALSGG